MGVSASRVDRLCEYGTLTASRRVGRGFGKNRAAGDRVRLVRVGSHHVRELVDELVETFRINIISSSPTDKPPVVARKFRLAVPSTR